MATYTVNIKIMFDAPVEKIFSMISNHETFGKIQGVKMKRIVDSDDIGNPNGVGSVRRFSIGLPLEEKIMKSEKNKVIEYTIIKGMHFFSSHYGSIHFSSINNKQSEMDYSITIGIKIPILSKLIINIIAVSLKKSFTELNKKLKQNPDYLS
jgi:hypothetical protein